VSPRKTPWFGIAFTTALSILLILTTDDLEGLSDTTVLLLTSVFLLVNIAVLVLRRDRVGHQHFTAPRFLPFVGAAVGLVFLLPIDRTAEIYRTAVFLLLGGLALWAVNFLVTRGRRAGPDHRPRGRRPALSRPVRGRPSGSMRA